MSARATGESGHRISFIEQSVFDAFDATKYTDEVREQMPALIRQKVDGEEITVQPAEEPTTQIIDLMGALKASRAGKKKAPAKKNAGRKQTASG